MPYIIIRFIIRRWLFLIASVYFGAPRRLPFHIYQCDWNHTSLIVDISRNITIIIKALLTFRLARLRKNLNIIYVFWMLAISRVIYHQRYAGVFISRWVDSFHEAWAFEKISFGSTYFLSPEYTRLMPLGYILPTCSNFTKCRSPLAMAEAANEWYIAGVQSHFDIIIMIILPSILLSYVVNRLRSI